MGSVSGLQFEKDWLPNWTTLQRGSRHEDPLLQSRIEARLSHSTLQNTLFDDNFMRCAHLWADYESLTLAI